MSKIRLVAYRKATSAATADTTYELDLQEHPNISLNFQFSDVKEPETRKGSYSQTFKLPFTNANNQFFENWFNVNLETLVFSTRTKFDAVLYVGTVPQFEGFIQLKSVYQKAKVYEITLTSNTANLFSTIGTQKLRDVFKEADGSYSAEFNHVFTYTNTTNNTLYNSWGNSLQNAAGDSLYDSGISVSKIVYPISVTQPNFYYNPNEYDAAGNNVKRFLRLDTAAISTIGDADTSSALSVSWAQFRPSIQIKSLIKLIIARAGFSYTSSFIDGAYFGKIFMTTGNHLELSATPTTNSNANPSGLMDVGNSSTWGITTTTATSEQNSQHIVEADTITPTTNNTAPMDADNIWNETYHYFTREDINMTQVNVRHVLTASNIAAYSGNDIQIQAILRPFDTSTNTPDLNYTYAEGNIINYDPPSTNIVYPGNHTLDLTQMPIGASAQVVILVSNYKSSGGTMTLTAGGDTDFSLVGFEVGNDLYSNIRMDWVGYSTDIYGATVDMPSCIDPDITQKAFLKDIIERFNLVVLTDPDDPANLIIEPYNDFIGSGGIKYWTDKLDTSKEIVVKDTTTLQKKTIHLTDQEDVDLYNKEFKERYPDINVYGHLKIDEINNDFATGEMKNSSIFSPFINSQVFADENTQQGTFLPNFSPQYEFSYEEKEGQYENIIKKTKPKLFWYNGTKTAVLDTAGAATTYNLHRVYDNSGTTTVTAFLFSNYPVCSPFDVTPSSNVYTLTSDTKSLYWNSSPPLVGALAVFNFNDSIGSWFNNTLYGGYWKQYLDNLYSSESRIMECHLNLNEVDIFNFSFADEIFIRDTYWRVLNISNYQVGAKASTKVTLIKVVDELVQAAGCDYVLGEVNGNNTLGNVFYLWCPEGTPGCTPNLTSGGGYAGLYTTPDCCFSEGGIPFYWATANASSGLYPCLANSGSLPIRIQSIFSITSILTQSQLKTLIFNKIGGLNRPFVRGVNNTKYSNPMIPLYGDDIVIKYGTKKRDTPQLEGESHRIVLSGHTSGNTRGYAYPEADKYNTPLAIPNNTNMVIRVKGIATVVGGTSSTYVLGKTEAFAYHTAFKNINGTVTQIGTAGGVLDWSIKEVSTTATLYISITNGILQFGLDDSQTDTKRIWQLSADIDINRINNLILGYDENWALYQNGRIIELQNGDYLIWN